MASYLGGYRYEEEIDEDISGLPLTWRARPVQTALDKLKSALGTTLQYFVDGKINEVPALNIVSKEKKQALFQLPYDNVEKVYALAEQSQVGTATKTLFKPDARKSRELSNVEVLNPEWSGAVSSICDQIREVLAPGATKVTASLYKLLLYQEGDFFNRHQDAQLADRMFGTLLFFLPVYHLGGEFSIFDPDNLRNAKVIGKPRADCSKEDINTAKPGKQCSWVAFYTDVRHQVSEVKEGYRVALNYSLSFEGAMSPSQELSSFDFSTSSAIINYFSVAWCNSMIAIPLKYDYTLSTLSPEYLKGYDAHLYNALSEISAPQLQFIVRFDKTRVVYMYDEPDNYQLFQGIFTITHDLAKQFFDICNEQERLLEEVERQGQESSGAHDSAYWKKREDVLSKCSDKYLELMKVVKESQKVPLVEWIVKRGYLGNPQQMKTNVYFNYGQLGWLGNMCPHEEYYYLSAAIVVAKESK